MASRNPFNLDNKNGGPEQPYVAKTWTPDEQTEKLSGYLEIPPEFWAQIKYGTHMRYFTKDGTFRPGGFVLKNPFDTQPKGATEDKRFVKLQNGFYAKAQRYASWIVAYEDIKKIFIKPDAGVLTMMQNLVTAISGLNNNIRKIAEHSKKLEQRVGILERK